MRHVHVIKISKHIEVESNLFGIDSKLFHVDLTFCVICLPPFAIQMHVYVEIISKINAPNILFLGHQN